EDKERVWLRIDFANAQRITHYNWATGNDDPDRDPADWRLQGSHDGLTWVDLDVKTGYSATATRNAWVTTEGFPISSVNTADVVNDNALVSVAQGAALVLDNVSETIAGLSGVGTVEVNNADLSVNTPAGLVCNYFGSIVGSGGLVKIGNGEWGLGGSNSFSGTLSVQQGTLALLGGSADRWFRYTIRENKGAVNVTQVAELALYSGDGVRRNLGLVHVSDVSTLQPGQCATPEVYAMGNPAAETPDKLFDNNTGTKWCLTLNTPTLSSPATYRVVVMRLADGSPEIASYNLCTANDYAERDPVNWTLESSPDGVTWRTVDTRTAVAAPEARYTWYNGGTAFALAERAMTAGAANVLAPGVALEVLSGATFDCRDGADAISALHVDMLDAGAMTVFKVAPGGTITISNASEAPAGLVLPLAIGTIEDRGNLGTWTVYVNGVRCEGVRLSVTSDGYLRLSPKGILIRIK
ncbi:MAG: autotransporter-associated beta strand repeat-containing protein, partial [Kiritimatiellae bacterium]|nr:autotransporter-associated beta strand repeat-containing protein [Kiritimatiellia bacterium]